MNNFWHNLEELRSGIHERAVARANFDAKIEYRVQLEAVDKDTGHPLHGAPLVQSSFFTPLMQCSELENHVVCDADMSKIFRGDSQNVFTVNMLVQLHTTDNQGVYSAFRFFSTFDDAKSAMQNAHASEPLVINGQKSTPSFTISVHDEDPDSDPWTFTLRWKLGRNALLTGIVMEHNPREHTRLVGLLFDEAVAVEREKLLQLATIAKSMPVKQFVPSAQPYANMAHLPPISRWTPENVWPRAQGTKRKESPFLAEQSKPCGPFDFWRFATFYCVFFFLLGGPG